MAKKATKQKRKCSLCRKAGHTKQKCPVLSIAKKKKNEREELENQKTSPIVLVKFAHQHKHSPHLIDLKQEQLVEKLEGIEVFQEKRKENSPRIEVVDFAAMARSANFRTRIKASDGRRFEKSTKKKIKLKAHWFSLTNYADEKVQNIAHGFGKILGLQKSAIIAVVILMLSTLPFPVLSYYHNLQDTSALVVQESTNAFLALQSSTVAALQSNLVQAEHDLNVALDSFGTANSILEKEYKAIQYVAGLLPIIGKQVTGRQHLLIAGHHLALGNTYLVKGIEEIEKNPSFPLTDKISVLRAHLRSSVPQYQEALAELTAVDSKVIPVEYQQSFVDFKLLFSAFVNDMQDLVDLAQALDLAFGGNDFKRYLIVFQNHHELRPTGGFMGSYALLDVQKGKILDLQIPGQGTYDMQGQLSVFLRPPLPLQLINKRWEFQDSNWFPDFAVSAQKMSWFYEKGRQTSVDGVIAINASVLERLLHVVGPISSETFGMQIDQESALASLQQEIEVDYDKELNQPKAVLTDFSNLLIEQIRNLDAVNVVRLLTELHTAANQKEVQVYFNDQIVQSKFSDFGWTGEISKTSDNQDYLLVINTNLHGQKSDAKIKQLIEHQAIVQEDGSVIDTVMIHRTHTGIEGESFYGVNNVDYIRTYVPEDSELISAGGFVYPDEEVFQVPEDWYKEDGDIDIYETEVAIHAQTGTRITKEFNKTAFGNWVMTPPGKTSVVYFTYKLPFKVFNQETGFQESFNKFTGMLAGSNVAKTSGYALVVQKQSGINSDFSTQVIYPDAWKTAWVDNQDAQLAANGVQYQDLLTTDRIIGVVMTKE